MGRGVIVPRDINNTKKRHQFNPRYECNDEIELWQRCVSANIADEWNGIINGTCGII